MDYKRIALAATVAWLVDSIYGIVLWIVSLSDQFASFPGVFRSQDTLNAGVPVMLGAGLLAMFALAFIYARGYEGGNGLVEGLRFGVLFGAFLFFFVSIPIYATLNIGSQLAVTMSIASFVEMLVVGVVIGAVYRHAGAAAPARSDFA